MAESYLFRTGLFHALPQSSRSRSKQNNNKWLEKIKWYSPATKQSFISSQRTFLTNRVTDWQCGDNEHANPEKENDARSPYTAIRPTSTLTNPK